MSFHDATEANDSSLGDTRKTEPVNIVTLRPTASVSEDAYRVSGARGRLLGGCDHSLNAELSIAVSRLPISRWPRLMAATATYHA